MAQEATSADYFAILDTLKGILICLSDASRLMSHCHSRETLVVSEKFPRVACNNRNNVEYVARQIVMMRTMKAPVIEMSRMWKHRP